MRDTPRYALNEHQKRHLRASSQEIDRLLTEAETILNRASQSPFPAYSDDLTPAQKKVVQDYIARLRTQLVRVLESQQISLPKPDCGVSRALQANLIAIDIIIEELQPKYMKGYGSLSDEATADLNGIVRELQGLVAKLNLYLTQDSEQNLQSRLERLEQTGDPIQLLKTLERVITTNGLVEFRPLLSTILDRLEHRHFEIVLFGRVSSGKSSLLNYLLQQDLLPVGVMPTHAPYLNRWLEQEVFPLLIARHHQLAEQSIRRKIGGLREAVIARLQRCLGQTQGKLASSSAQRQSAKADLRQAIAQFETTRITCERLIDEIGQLTPVAIARAASEVINGWLSGRDKMPDPGDRIKSVLIRVSAEKATELQAQLNTLAVSLFQTLTHLGQTLEAETIPTKEEFTHCIREMPPMDVATLHVGLRRSFLLLLNKQIAEYQVEKSLQQQIGNTVTETFQAYRKLLQIWTAKILSNLQHQFDNYADPYRANLEQESGDVVSNELDKAILQQDLDKLIRWHTSNETSVTPCYPTPVERLNV